MEELAALLSQKSACKGMDPGIFFPIDERGEKIAKQVCATCPVIDACWQLHRREEHGIWAGMNHLERVRHHRKMRRAANRASLQVRALSESA